MAGTTSTASDQVLSSIVGTGMSPAVVVDQVGMTYKVKSNEYNDSNADNKVIRLLRRIAGYNSVVRVDALRPLSLVIYHGESVGIVGRNGSGKSTLMKIIGGHQMPTTGSVYASSVPVALSVNAALVPELPGGDNITLGCLAMGMTRPEIAQRFDAIVELSGLESAIHLPMVTYSSGMSARLTFAIAASVNPEILMLDEALNTGDAQFKDRTKARLDEIRMNAGSLFLVSHSLTTINHMCNRAIWLDKGELLMDDIPGKVTRAYALFTGHLAKGEVLQAEAIRDNARQSLVETKILDTATGQGQTV